jgi:DNA-binding protein YbaB
MDNDMISKVYKKNEIEKLRVNTEICDFEKQAITDLITSCRNDAFIHIARMISELSHERLMKKLSE